MRLSTYPLLIYFVTFVSAVEVITEDQRLQDFMDHVIEIQAFCESKENATVNDDLDSNEDFQESHEWKCTLECVATELGIVSFSFFNTKILKNIGASSKKNFP